MKNYVLSLADIDVVNDTIREMRHYKIEPSISNIIQYINKYFKGFIGSPIKEQKIVDYLEAMGY